MPPRTQKISVPFAAGVRQDIDAKLLPQGLFVNLENARYRKDGRLGLRNGYASISMATEDGFSLVPFDLVAYHGRLVVLGNERSEGFPTALYEYTGLPGIGWKTPTGDFASHVVNPFTDMRALQAPPQAAGGVLTPLAVGACHGYAMVAYRASGASGALYVYVIRETDNQVVLSEAVSGFITHAVICTPSNGSGGRCFILVGYNAFTRGVGANRFDPNSDTALVSLGALRTTPDVVTVMTAAEVAGTNQFVVAEDRGATDLSVYRFNTSGVQQGSTIALASTTPEYLAVEASTAGSGTINLLHMDGTTLTLRTWTFAGALTGPTTLSSVVSTDAANPPRIARLPANAALGWAEAVACFWGEDPAGSEIPQTLHIDGRTVAAHSQVINQTIADFAITTRVIALPTAAQAVAFAFGGTLRDTGTLADPGTNTLVYFAGSNGFAKHFCTVDTLTALNAAGDLARDASTGRLIWGKQVLNANEEGILSVASCAVQSSAPRQIAEQQGDLFFAAAQPQTWNGDLLAEVGFQTLPSIRSTSPTNSSGQLANSASYDYVATWEWLDGQGQLVRSVPSQPVTVVTGASDDTVILQVTTPHQLRGSLGFTSIPSAITVIVWRTAWDGTAKVTGFRKAATVTSTTTTGSTVTILDLASDAFVLAGELLYTDGGSGALSGGIPRLSPQPAAYLAASDTVVLMAGLPDRTQFQESIPVLSGESVAFCPFADVGVSFYGNCQRDIIGAAVVDGTRVFFHSDGISLSTGAGPDADGRGSIPTPQLVPTNFGLRDRGWRSLLLTADGLWFQAGDDKLCLLPRGGGTPTWAGQAIRGTLATFKDIAAATLAHDDNVAVWAANTGLGAGVLIVRDQRSGDWMIDRIPGGLEVRGLAQQSGKLVYITSATCRRQSDDFDDGTTQLIPLLAETGDFTVFGLNGWGEIVTIALLAEFRDACTVRGSISYDGGITWAPLREYALDGTGTGPGAVLELLFYPRVRKCSRFRLRFEVVDLSGPSEGVVLNGLDLYVLSQGGPPRKANNRRV